MTEFEVYLWRCNEARTYMYTGHEMMTVDNTKKSIDLKVWHIAVDNDKYFNNTEAVRHMQNIFSEVEIVRSISKKHSPSVMTDKKAASVFFPNILKKAFKY